MNIAKEWLSSFEFGDMILSYELESESGKIGIRVLPKGMEHLACVKDCNVEPLIQAKIAGDIISGGFAQGRTMRGGQTVDEMRYSSQNVNTQDGITVIETTLCDARGYRYVHRLEYRDGSRYLAISGAFYNESSQEITLEMMSSFTLGGLTPFEEGDTEDQLELYKMRSGWSAEGRLVHESVENAHMEASWSRHAVMSSRWGQIGSMPIREYVPMAAVEDKVYGVIWAAQLTHASSWQLEAGRKDYGFFLSGGLADREFGHWTKNIADGESFTVPDAVITVTAAGIDDACERLIEYTEDRMKVPESEEALPPLFNEYCTTWGTPQDESIAQIAEHLKGLGLEYFVIDAGWYAQRPGAWDTYAGNWDISEFLFKKGLDYTLDKIRECGMKPGIWFEFEVIGRDCTRFSQTDWMLKRDGEPITVGTRRFWDFRMPEVQEYLHEKVIEFLKAHDFKYIKVDYNETLGIGVDGQESQGEGLRTQIEAVQQFFKRMREELPDLVIEVCSSGGHRMVPSFMTLGSQVSITDAHECEEIPIIAANMHRMIPIRQSQIWAVVHSWMTDAQLYYKLTGGMLGRICLSGEVLNMNEHQWEIIRNSLDFYRSAAPIIKKGHSHKYGIEPTSWRKARGWQAVVRQGEEKVLVVAHTFHDTPSTVRFPIPEGYEIEQICARDGIRFAVCAGQMIITGLSDLDGAAVLLKKQ